MKKNNTAQVIQETKANFKFFRTSFSATLFFLSLFHSIFYSLELYSSSTYAPDPNLLPKAVVSDAKFYYPQEIQEIIKNPQSINSKNFKQLRDQLYLALNVPHQVRKKENKPDLLCEYSGQQKLLPVCAASESYRFNGFDYSQARVYLFNYVNAKEAFNHTFQIEDYYCEKPKVIDLDQADGKTIPSGTGMNTEHVWPQSKFTQNYLGPLQGVVPTGEKKSNLHILVPTTTDLNTLRSSYPFGQVAELHSTSQNTKCQNGDTKFSKFGYRKEDRALVFEPPVDRQGDIARIIFYFAVKYNMNLVDEVEEATLRSWHQADPVDQRERARHEMIARIQNNRNPFIDYPQLVELIKNY